MCCPNRSTIVHKPIKQSKRTDQIMRLLKTAYEAQFKHASGKSFIALALKIERMLYREFPADVNIVLSTDVLAVKLRFVIAKVLQAKVNTAHARTRPTTTTTTTATVAKPAFSIQSMLN
ncbi:hypothetical protein AC1031_010142 [Aphanomyces cochlioides]|nr:hypothetical protein AC1031_010142 [Aphanomyces cochlioides]